METVGLPQRIQQIFDIMVKNPSIRSHLLLIGPPGSGKTTSARYFVEALHGKGANARFFGRALFLNSSDERGLEAVRSRVYPFVRSSFQALFPAAGAPKIIVFDEAETLTDQAQIALRPLLDQSPQKVLIIFLCNSISRIHPSIVHKFLTIPFEAPNPAHFQFRMSQILSANSKARIPAIDVEFRRGDIRFFILNPNSFQDCAKLWNDLFTCHRSQIQSLFEQTLLKWTYPDLAMFCLFSAKKSGCLERAALVEMIQISDTDFIKIIKQKQRATLLANWFTKFVREKLEAWPPVLKPTQTE
jgi:DNA polymerase III delta prime subunit